MICFTFYTNLCIFRTSRDFTQVFLLHPSLQPLNCLAYLNIKGIEFAKKKLYHFWSSFLTTVQCNSVENLTFFCLVWINRDNFAQSSTLLMVSFTMVICVNTTMTRFSIGTIGINKIYHLFCIIITFPLPISKKLEEFLCFILIKDALSDKRLSFDLKSGFTSFTGSNIYRSDKMLSILYLIDKNALACATQLGI